MKPKKKRVKVNRDVLEQAIKFLWTAGHRFGSIDEDDHKGAEEASKKSYLLSSQLNLELMNHDRKTGAE